MTSILDTYIKKPLLYDLLVILMVVVSSFCLNPCGKLNTPLKLENLNTILSNVINTSISLAGFVLASLTIIVTFKDNINHKEVSEKIREKQALTGMELIFTSKHYKRIVGVFSWSCFIFLILFFLLTICSIFLDNLNFIAVFNIVVASVLLVTFTIFRCLLILHKIIQIQITKS